MDEPAAQLPNGREQTPPASDFAWRDWSRNVARLSAPVENGGKLIAPALEYVGAMARANRDAVVGSSYDLQGRPLAAAACEARQQLVAAALEYTRGYRDVASPSGTCSIFLAGHQPEMFHPGVWLKNFVLDRIARQHQSIAINLQIDSDAVKGSALRVPTGSLDNPRAEAVAFDRAGQGAPFEQRSVLDPALFESFGQRAAEAVSPIIDSPLLRTYWPLVTARLQATNNLGACISQARHQLEGQWGLTTLEAPQSQVCDLPMFRWFVVHLLAQLPRFRQAYNQSILAYRRKHRVRSTAHPAPALEADGDWLEAPLWIWCADNPRRRRVFVRQRQAELQLTDRAAIDITLPLTSDRGAAAAVEQLAALAARGLRLRTRALITTLGARLLLGDLFMHGIGGAKYDELTDRIIEQFFGIQPPGYLCVSGTLRLPISQQFPSSDTAESLRQQIRELSFHPERFLSASTDLPNRGLDRQSIEQAIREKQRWIATAPTADNARQRCHAIRAVNEALQPALDQRRTAMLQAAEQAERFERHRALLSSREFAFPLFPEPVLQEFLSADPGKN